MTTLAPAGLLSDAEFVRRLTVIFNGDIVYDHSQCVWVGHDREYTGSGRAYFIISRDGHWFHAVVPAEQWQ